MNGEGRLEIEIRRLAAAFEYPATPDLAAQVAAWSAWPGRRPGIAGRLRSTPAARRLAWAALILLVLAASALAVPPVRAALVEVFRLGAVQVQLGEPTPSAAPVEVVLPGETTLEAARAISRIPIPLPAALGEPDRVFRLQALGDTIVLVWEQEAIALYVIPTGPIVRKLAPERVEPATVDGRPAIWATGDHFIELLEGRPGLRMFVTSHVLIWETETATYRLETDRSLPEAVEIAESLP